MAKSAAGRLNPEKGSEIDPGVSISKKIPLPPNIVNQKQVTKGAIIAIIKIICLAVRPLEIRAINIPINGA